MSGARGREVRGLIQHITNKERTNMTEEKYMWMRSPGHALDVIAELMHDQKHLKDQASWLRHLEEQDAWLRAVVKLGYVQLEGGEEHEN